MNIFDLVPIFDSLDHKRLTEHLARHNPDALLEAYHAIYGLAPAWTLPVLEDLNAGNNIPAARKLRQFLACDLRTSIEVCYLLRGRLPGSLAYPDGAPFQPSSAALRIVADHFARYGLESTTKWKPVTF